jgi:hypothetical protein
MPLDDARTKLDTALSGAYAANPTGKIIVDPVVSIWQKLRRDLHLPPGGSVSLSTKGLRHLSVEGMRFLINSIASLETRMDG